MFTWRYLIRLLANARKVQLTYGEGRKTDKIDAEKLARLAQLDSELLSPIKHCGESSQCRLALLHSRAALVGTSTKLITHVRSTVKSFRLAYPKHGAKLSPRACRAPVEGLAPAMGAVLETIASFDECIRMYNRRLEEMADELCTWRRS